MFLAWQSGTHLITFCGRNIILARRLEIDWVGWDADSGLVCWERAFSLRCDGSDGGGWYRLVAVPFLASVIQPKGELRRRCIEKARPFLVPMPPVRRRFWSVTTGHVFVGFLRKRDSWTIVAVRVGLPNAKMHRIGGRWIQLLTSSCFSRPFRETDPTLSGYAHFLTRKGWKLVFPIDNGKWVVSSRGADSFFFLTHNWSERERASGRD